MSGEIRVLEELRGEIERVAGAGSPRRVVARWRPIALLAALVLGGATAALAAAGVFATGTPIGPNVPLTPNANVGVAIPGGAQLLALRVPDPSGGPPWGLRMVRTTRGLVCLQIGRIADGEIGALGQDGAFANDGRLHPFSVNYEEFGASACATLDAGGNGFFSATWQALPASAFGAGCAAYGNGPGPSCPVADLRDVYYGLLGPDAVSVTYAGANGALVTERTAGPDGAYLVVGPPTRELCRDFGRTRTGRLLGACGNGGTVTPALRAGPVRTVTYRNGSRCRLPGPTARGDYLDVSCPLVGYRGSGGRPTPAQLATAIHLSVGRTAELGALLDVSFTARVAVPNASSFYTVHYGSPSCYGPSSTAVTDSDLAAGATVHERFQLLCVGVQHVIVEYYPSDGASLGSPIQRSSDGKLGIPVGQARLTVTVRSYPTAPGR